MSSEQGERSGTQVRILDAVLASLTAGEPDMLNMGAIAKRAGVSRQAVYLHFPNRGTLAVEAARWLDERENLEQAVAPVINAPSIDEMLARYARFWADFNPRIAPVARMLQQLRANPALNDAWLDRLAARQAGSRLLAQRIKDADRLQETFTVASAGDWMAAVGSVSVWEELTQDLGWSSTRYVEHMTLMLQRTLLTSARRQTTKAKPTTPGRARRRSR